MHSEPANIAVKLSYDGTDYSGFQIQKNGRSIQEELETALLKINDRPVRITAAGRTDAGVHALGQVINFRSTLTSVAAERYAFALNSLLPKDIRAIKSVEVARDFHARKDARYREYRYYMLSGQQAYPFFSRYCIRLKTRPDIGLLNRLASPLVGVHDFETFTAAADPSPSRVREIVAASFFIQHPFIVFRIKGNGFLWKMVRSILGTILGLEKEGALPEDMRRLLESEKRENAGATVSPAGLFLHEVDYETEIFG